MAGQNDSEAKTEFNEHAAATSLCTKTQEKYALHIAAANGNHEKVTALITEGVPTEIQDAKGWTALHHAVWAGDKEMVELILTLGAYPNPITGDGKYPSCLTKERGFEEIETLIRSMTEQKQPTALLAEWLENPRTFLPGKRRSMKKPTP